MIGTNGNYLLDTNIVIPILNQDVTLLARIENLVLYIPIFVLGELYFGARKSAQSTLNTARVDTLKSRFSILRADESTAREYGLVRNQLQAKGRPIPENDMWIAACAIQYSLTLVTRDDHFKEIDNLKLEIW